MSARSVFPKLPDGVLVFRNKEVLLHHRQTSGEGHHPPSQHVLAPLKKGVSGVAMFDNAILQCVVYKSQWVMAQVEVLTFRRVRSAAQDHPTPYPPRSECSGPSFDGASD